MEHKLMTQIKKLQQINSNWEYKGKYGYIVDQDTGETICKPHYNDKEGKRAKLIASAPDLLQVLKDILHTGVAFNMEKVEKAINKATK